MIFFSLKVSHYWCWITVFSQQLVLPPPVMMLLIYVLIIPLYDFLPIYLSPLDFHSQPKGPGDNLYGNSA
jgi:hypothetical protein